VRKSLEDIRDTIKVKKMHQSSTVSEDPFDHLDDILSLPDGLSATRLNHHTDLESETSFDRIISEHPNQIVVHDKSNSSEGSSHSDTKVHISIDNLEKSNPIQENLIRNQRCLTEAN
jgi:hypothetical protein